MNEEIATALRDAINKLLSGRVEEEEGGGRECRSESERRKRTGCDVRLRCALAAASVCWSLQL